MIDRFFFRLPLALHAGGSLFEIGDALFDLLQPGFRTVVFFALQGQPLNLQLHDFAFNLIDLNR